MDYRNVLMTLILSAGALLGGCAEIDEPPPPPSPTPLCDGCGPSTNLIPKAENQSVELFANTSLALELVASDDDAGDVLTLSISAQPAHGLINAEAPFVYVPNPGYSGPDSFKFVANDGTDTSLEAEVSINVKAPAMLTVSPVSTNFGNIVLGLTSAAQVLTLTNSGDVAASNLTATSPVADFRFPGGAFPGGGSCGTSLAAKATCTVRIEYRPVAVGALSRNLSISYRNGASGTAITLSYAVQGLGSQPGTLDATFATAGKKKGIQGNTALIERAGIVRVEAASNHIVIAGSKTTGLVRMLASGAPFTAWSTKGIAQSPAQISDGDALGMLFVTNSSGTTTSVLRMGVYRQNNVNKFYVVRNVWATGQLDATFSGDGFLELTQVRQTDGDYNNPFNIGRRDFWVDAATGKISLLLKHGTTNTAVLVRLNANGTPDTSLSTTGTIAITDLADYCQGIDSVVQGSNMIVMGKNAAGDIRVIRLKPQGTTWALDATFGTAGKTDIAHLFNVNGPTSVTINNNLVYVVMPRQIVRLLSTGALDNHATTGYGTNHSGKITLADLPTHNTVRVNGGMFYFVGLKTNTSTDSDFQIIRYKADGTIDTAFGTNGIIITKFSDGTTLRLSRGKGIAFIGETLVVAGMSSSAGQDQIAIARYFR